MENTLKYYFEKQSKIFKLEGKAHKKIILHRRNYTKHIKIQHPEINMKKIISILENPDSIYKSSHNSPDCYYEKQLENSNYRVVITKYKGNIKAVVTAYQVNNIDGFSRKHIHCIYDKDVFMYDEQLQVELENDMDYFLQLFNIE